jgi:hypothetical protein
MKQEVDLVIIVNESAMVHVVEKGSKGRAQPGLHKRFSFTQYLSDKTLFISFENKFGILIGGHCLGPYEHISLWVCLNFYPPDRLELNLGMIILGRKGPPWPRWFIFYISRRTGEASPEE